jgi:hypothetical protein
LEHEQLRVLAEAREGIDGGHYAEETRTHKVLRTGLWWPKVHKYAKEYFHNCDVCQRLEKHNKRDEMPLRP